MTDLEVVSALKSSMSVQDVDALIVMANQLYRNVLRGDVAYMWEEKMRTTFIMPDTNIDAQACLIGLAYLTTTEHKDALMTAAGGIN